MMKSLMKSLLIIFIATFLLCCESNISNERSYEKFLSLPIDERLRPENATGSFETSNDLEVELFAHEPMVVNPTNIDVDAKGRVWVLESYNYGLPEEEQTEEGGRIIILEDTDQDGKADKRTVFYQGMDVHIALGIAVLGNKIFVTRSPHLLVFTDEDSDDIPDKKEVLFTGMKGPGDHSGHAVVFGPDGKLYWNMGNQGGIIQKTNGDTVLSTAGHPVIAYGRDYIGGMIFRCNPDGSDFEVLAHNFRNNYEVAVDSYGNIWQSDNDDDGNKSCRINFILEYGNYGYLDEFSRESWHTHRTHMEETTSRQHWHQNDPGVVPNLFITGAGSPAGITFYEGDLLPDIFQSTMIHVDAGPNVVRAYPTKKLGAGYQASISNILKSIHDQWFRPIDVTTAPDGSLFVGDWYDPGVGGGVAADHQKGRIYRIAPTIDRYESPDLDLENVSGAIEALKSPNMSRRFLGWMKLIGEGKAAEKDLAALLQDSDPVIRARALWLLGKLPGKAERYTEIAIKDDNPDIRIVGIRLARQNAVNFIDLAQKIMDDPAPDVRRELAIGLHLLESPEAAKIWAQLAMQYDGQDRWYLEALGIGAENNWDHCFEAWKVLAGDDWMDGAGKDIVWRSRNKSAIPLLAEIIRKSDANEYPKYFRAFDFHADESKHPTLLRLLGNNPEMTTLALQHIDPEKVGRPEILVEALHETLLQVEGSMAYVNLIRKFELTDQKTSLLNLAISKPGEDVGVAAGRLLLSPPFESPSLIFDKIGDSEETGLKLVSSIGKIGNRSALDLLKDVVLDPDLSFEVRKAATMALGNSWTGEEVLLSAVKSENFDERLKPAAGSVLFNVYRDWIQDEAAKLIPRPGTSGGNTLPTIRNLVPASGLAANGEKVFKSYCETCHIVNGEGIAFGPDLSEIGSKLSKEGLYRAIIYPSEGINYDYQSVMLKLKDGSSVLGIVESESENFVELRMMGGIKNKYMKSDIDSKEAYPQSLMTNLSSAMVQQELIDLVTYLGTLRKAEPEASL